MTFKDLQKLVAQSNETGHIMNYFKDCKVNHFGYGTNSSINKKTLEQMEIAALTT
jgi:hypothetical protein